MEGKIQLGSVIPKDRSNFRTIYNTKRYKDTRCKSYKDYCKEALQKETSSIKKDKMYIDQLKYYAKHGANHLCLKCWGIPSQYITMSEYRLLIR